MPIILFLSFCTYSEAQVELSSKEEIKITSNFKPSIIKKGKVVFFASPPESDSIVFSFKYDLPNLNVKTPVKSFTISPLDIERQKINEDSAGFYGKVGYGNMQNPFAHLSFEDDNANRTIAIWGKHISAKGPMQDQQFANSSIGASIDSRLNEYQKIVFYAGYELDKYRQYGFDHTLFNFNQGQLDQQYKHFNTTLSFSSLGKDGTSSILPSLHFSNLNKSRKASENAINIAIPFTKRFTEYLSLKSRPAMDLVFFNKSIDSSTSTSLFQLPLTGTFSSDVFNLEGGFNAVSWKSATKLLPALELHYKPLNSKLGLLIEIANKTSINSLYSLTTQNPYIDSPDSLSIFQQVDYGAGMKLTLEKRFSIKVKGGYTTFMNLPLYINSGISGKDLRVIYLSDLKAVNFKTEFLYSPTSQFDFRANFISYYFSGKSKSEKAYGFIPTEFSADLTWKPTRNLKLNSSIKVWKGPWAYSESKLDHLLKNVADLNMGIDYDLNKKCGIWLDLNNIANVKYERWSQYASFGFNIVGGARFQLFNKKRIN